MCVCVCGVCSWSVWDTILWSPRFETHSHSSGELFVPESRSATCLVSSTLSFVQVRPVVASARKYSALIYTGYVVLCVSVCPNRRCVDASPLTCDGTQNASGVNQVFALISFFIRLLQKRRILVRSAFGGVLRFQDGAREAGREGMRRLNRVASQLHHVTP